MICLLKKKSMGPCEKKIRWRGMEVAVIEIMEVGKKDRRGSQEERRWLMELDG